MKAIDQLERRFGRYYIPRLMTGIIVGQVAVWVLTMLVNRQVYSLLTLSRAALLHGQLWRLVSFVFVPDLIVNPILFAVSMYFYYFIGNALENYWGGFRFNLYYLVGILGAWAACLISGSSSDYGIFLSLFLAFAWLCPNLQVLLFFIIPIKVKWMGWFSAALWAIQLVTTRGLFNRLALVVELAPFLLFFGRDIWHWVHAWCINRRRRNQYRDNNPWR